MKTSIVITIVVSLFIGAGSAIAATRLLPASQTGNDWFAASYANGPGAASSRSDLAAGGETLSPSLDYLQPSLVPLGSETHSGEDVGIYASGPQAHLFHGVVEQNYIGHVIIQALRIK